MARQYNTILRVLTHYLSKAQYLGYTLRVNKALANRLNWVKNDIQVLQKFIFVYLFVVLFPSGKIFRNINVAFDVKNAFIFKITKW